MVLVPVIDPSLLLVTQDCIGLVDFLELLFILLFLRL